MHLLMTFQLHSPFDPFPQLLVIVNQNRDFKKWKIYSISITEPDLVSHRDFPFLLIPADWIKNNSWMRYLTLGMNRWPSPIGSKSSLSPAWSLYLYLLKIKLKPTQKSLEKKIY